MPRLLCQGLAFTVDHHYAWRDGRKYGKRFATLSAADLFSDGAVGFVYGDRLIGFWIHDDLDRVTRPLDPVVAKEGNRDCHLHS